MRFLQVNGTDLIIQTSDQGNVDVTLRRVSKHRELSPTAHILLTHSLTTLRRRKYEERDMWRSWARCLMMAMR